MKRAFTVSVAPRRQPWLAGLLSASVPGAGQRYAGHPVDALQAFVFVSAFGFTSYVAYGYDQQQGNPYLLTGAALLVTTFFYGANIVGAIRTAVYDEQRIYEELLAATEREIGNLTLEPAEPRK